MITETTLQTKQELVREFENIIKTLIQKGILKYNPIRNIKYMDKKRLIEGINIFKQKLEVKK